MEIVIFTWWFWSFLPRKVQDYLAFLVYGNICNVGIPVSRIMPCPWISFDKYIPCFQLIGNLETNVEFRCSLWNSGFCIHKSGIFHSAGHASSNVTNMSRAPTCNGRHIVWLEKTCSFCCSRTSIHWALSVLAYIYIAVASDHNLWTVYMHIFFFFFFILPQYTASLSVITRQWRAMGNSGMCKFILFMLYLLVFSQHVLELNNSCHYHEAMAVPVQ